jgi:hypothetical protein
MTSTDLWPNTTSNLQTYTIDPKSGLKRLYMKDPVLFEVLNSEIRHFSVEFMASAGDHENSYAAFRLNFNIPVGTNPDT